MHNAPIFARRSMHRHWRYLIPVLLMIVVAHLAASPNALDDPFLPKGATVVLFPGLPGDLESERTYSEQLQSLLQLARESAAERILIFSDAPQPSLENPKVQHVKPSRAAFLEAAAQLPASTNPAVAFIWGHGGMQGPTPVFHVRGPRLTPADFKQFADKLTSGPSTWVLMFRGSGRFGAELAAEQRHVLASEGQSMFRNDPIAMNVLLKIWRSKTDSTLRHLLHSFGPGVARWFDEQNLARTEEPTLWAGTEPPRALLAAPLLLEAPSTAAEAPQKPDPPPQTNAPSSWGNLVRVNPSDYPDADSIILERRLSYVLAASPAVTAEHEEYIQILTSEGKDAGDFDISFSPPHEKLEFLSCELQRPDGSVVQVDPDEIRETDHSDQATGSPTTQRKFFSMPDVQPGAIIHVRYTREWQKFPLPHVTLTLPLADEAPLRKATIRVSVPKDSPLHFRSHHIALPDPKIIQTDYSTAYTWELQNLPPSVTEPLTTPDYQPSLLISTFPDWKTFAAWYQRLIRLADQPTADITNKAHQIAGHLPSPHQKIAALYNYVTSLRYVAVPLGVNSFRPHSAAAVLRNQYGDCKDKANLLNALLQSQGITSHLVLVPRFGQAYTNLPGFAFNHAISRVTLHDGQPLWLDTTDDVCLFGTLPPGDPGRRVLVIDGSDQLAELPRPLPRHNTIHITATIDATRHPPPTIHLDASATGYADYTLRTAARDIARHRGQHASLPLWDPLLRLANGTFALQQQNFTPPSDLATNFQLRASGTLLGILHPLNHQPPSTFTLTPPVQIPAEWTVALHARTQPLFLNDGYPFSFTQQATIKLPEGTRLLTPQDRQATGLLNWTFTVSQPAADNTLHLTLKCELTKAELSLAETAPFQRQLRELFTALAQPVILSLSKPQ